MKLLFLTFVSVCWLGLVSAGNIWDEYLDDGVPASPVELDEQPWTPLFLPGVSDSGCKRRNLEHTINKFVADDNKQTPLQQSRLRIAQNCKENLEKKLTVDLADIDNQVKERVSLLVEILSKDDGNYFYHGRDFYALGESIPGAILETIKQSGTDLSSTKTVNEVDILVDNLLKDCKQLYKHLHNFHDAYQLFLNKESFKPEPIAVQWTKNAEICRYLDDTAYRGNYATRVYRLMYPTKSEPSEPSAQIKRSKFLDMFTKKSKLNCFGCFD